MAMDVGGSPSGPIAHINVTPMADVMIVLLIIFMVTVPVLTREVDLPDAAHAREGTKEGRVTLTLRRDGSIVLGEDGPVAPFALAARLRERLGGSPATIYLQADEDVAYDQVQRVMNACREAGAAEVALAADPGIEG